MIGFVLLQHGFLFCYFIILGQMMQTIVDTKGELIDFGTNAVLVVEGVGPDTTEASITSAFDTFAPVKVEYFKFFPIVFVQG